MGFVFMVIWAARFATKQQLKSAISWFLAIGIIGALLGGTFGMPLRRMGSLKSGAAWMMSQDDKGWFGCPGANGALNAGSASSAAR